MHAMHLFLALHLLPLSRKRTRYEASALLLPGRRSHHLHNDISEDSALTREPLLCQMKAVAQMLFFVPVHRREELFPLKNLHATQGTSTATTALTRNDDVGAGRGIKETHAFVNVNACPVR